MAEAIVSVSIKFAGHIRNARTVTVAVNSLSKIYGKQKAIDNLNFNVSKGEVVGFLGPNGAGKSTTMKILTCFIEPSSGTASVCGYDIFKDSVQVRRHVGYLPEHNPLYLDMYVKEYLVFSAKMNRISGSVTRRVKDLVEKTGLGAEQHKKIKQLSKGYRQRVGLAHALLHDPEVLILDEPTSGLDPNQIVEIRNLIKEVSQEKTILLSTHIMQEVQAMCDRVMVINKGKIVADDKLDLMLEQYSGRRTIHLELLNKMSAKEIRAIQGVQDVVQDGESTFTLSCDSSEPVRERLFELLSQKKNPILRLEPKLENLESIFRQLTTEAS